MPPNPTELLRRQSTVRALETRQDLGYPMDQPVDVFEAIRRAGLWLMFQPLDGLFGLYVRGSGAAGAVLNVKVHPALQRFTAAHELGHHALGHRSAFDTEGDVERWGGLRHVELAAQFFAAEFLMPVATVNRTAKDLGIARNTISEHDVYQLSLRLRTSYVATVYRLLGLDWITRSVAERLRSVPPQRIKRSILSHELPDGRSDVWVIHRVESTHIPATVGDELVLTLPETPSSGYRWRMELPLGIAAELDDFGAGTSGDVRALGGQRQRRIHLSVQAPSQSVALLTLERAWAQGDAIERFTISVGATARPVTGLSPEQQELLLIA